MAKNIEINYNSGSGYEVLYPKTLPELTGCLPLTGGTLTGPLTLSGEPSGEMEAVNKGYVDGQMAGILKPMYEGELDRGSGYVSFAYSAEDAKILFVSIYADFFGPTLTGSWMKLEGDSGYVLNQYSFGKSNQYKFLAQSIILIKTNNNYFSSSLMKDDKTGGDLIRVTDSFYYENPSSDEVSYYLTVFGIF